MTHVSSNQTLDFSHSYDFHVHESVPLLGFTHPRCLNSLALSQAVVDAGAVPLLVLSLQEPELALKRIAASTLSELSKHTPELAQMVVDNGAIPHLAQMILNPDAKLKVEPEVNLIVLKMFQTGSNSRMQNATSKCTIM